MEIDMIESTVNRIYYQAEVIDECMGGSQHIGNFRKRIDAVAALVIQAGVSIDGYTPMPEQQRSNSNCYKGTIKLKTEAVIVENLSEFDPSLPEKWRQYLQWQEDEIQQLQKKQEEWQQQLPELLKQAQSKLSMEQMQFLTKTASDDSELIEQLDILIENLNENEVRALELDHIVIRWQKLHHIYGLHTHFDLVKSLRELQKSKK